jgi:hypothetical protein
MSDEDKRGIQHLPEPVQLDLMRVCGMRIVGVINGEQLLDADGNVWDIDLGVNGMTPRVTITQVKGGAA